MESDSDVDFDGFLEEEEEEDKNSRVLWQDEMEKSPNVCIELIWN